MFFISCYDWLFERQPSQARSTCLGDINTCGQDCLNLEPTTILLLAETSGGQAGRPAVVPSYLLTCNIAAPALPFCMASTAPRCKGVPFLRLDEVPDLEVPPYVNILRAVPKDVYGSRAKVKKR
jgi:hypothetical protein